MQYIVQNVDKKKKPKRTNFEMIMDFVERERDLKRKDKIELDKEKTIREKQDQKNRKNCDQKRQIANLGAPRLRQKEGARKDQQHHIHDVFHGHSFSFKP